MNSRSGILQQFNSTDGLKTLSATQFLEVWNHFDTDGNGFIENQELDSFIRELSGCIPQYSDISEAEVGELKSNVLKMFDRDKDNKINIKEMASILPTDENFLMLFQLDNPLESSVDFMAVWKMFDKDCSGYIEANELKSFIKELLKSSHRSLDVDEDDLLGYTDAMLNLFDRNHDGKLQLSEMARLIPTRENFLMRPVFRQGIHITDDDVTTAFDLYDKDKNGKIENDELHGFVKDLLELVYEDYDSDDLESLEESLMKLIDIDKDGKISKNELLMIIRQFDQMSEMRGTYRNSQPRSLP